MYFLFRSYESSEKNLADCTVDITGTGKAQQLSSPLTSHLNILNGFLKININ